MQAHLSVAQLQAAELQRIPFQVTMRPCRGLVFSARVRAGLGRRKLEPGAPRAREARFRGAKAVAADIPCGRSADKGTHARCGGAADLYYTDGNGRRSFCLWCHLMVGWCRCVQVLESG